ncbi:MAG: LytR family transcriptional regulator [Actinobacteria bacterium]|nr:LytR family transcriptional regulator [Actinomycetota bacterium]
MKTRRAIRIITTLSVSIVVLASISWLGLGQVSGQISRISVFGNLKDRPEKTSQAINYLVVGSDSREGLTQAQIKKLKVGSTAVAAGGRSDTMFLIHISKSRDAAFIVSLPRDTLVQVPAHISQDGKRDIPEKPGKLNAAFAFGGAPLLIQTIEAKTNLKIDHYVEISFAGFTGVVDALGGIQVCSKVPINDPKSHLVMSAGTHILDGLEALKYVRTRDFDGRGDIGRMERQQQFVSAVVRKATSSGTLLNPIKLAKFYNATISTVKMDEGVDKNDLLTLAKQMRNLSSGNIRTLTVPLSDPNGRVAGVGSVVIWDEELSADLWTRIRNDQALVDTIKPSPTSSAQATAKPEVVDKFKTKTAAENPCAASK